VIGHRFDDGPHVADMHAFFEHALQHLLQGAERQQLGHQILDQLGHFLGQMIQQLLHFLTAKQFGSMRQDQMIQVRRDHCRRIDHGIAIGLRLLALPGIDPDRRQAKAGSLVAVPFSVPATRPGLIARCWPV
jgi:hypothetical protein